MRARLHAVDAEGRQLVAVLHVLLLQAQHAQHGGHQTALHAVAILQTQSSLNMSSRHRTKFHAVAAYRGKLLLSTTFSLGPGIVSVLPLQAAHGKQASEIC